MQIGVIADCDGASLRIDVRDVLRPPQRQTQSFALADCQRLESIMTAKNLTGAAHDRSGSRSDTITLGPLG